MATVCATLKRGPMGLGFNIKGGKGHGIPILISKIDPLGSAANIPGLEVGAEIVAVNVTNIEGATHAEAVTALKQDGDLITLTLRPHDIWNSKTLSKLWLTFR
jgi:hypothetical protein